MYVVSSYIVIGYRRDI